MKKQTFATSIHCIDGRIQIPVIDFSRRKAGVDYVDVITRAGIVSIFANNKAVSEQAAIKKQIEVSIEKHQSGNVYVAAHHDCAANRVDDSVQMKQVSKAVEIIRTWFPQVEVYGLWVDEGAKVRKIE